MGINDFKSNFNGGARPTLFRVTQTFPAGVATGTAGRRFEYFCKGAQLPGDTMGFIDVMYMGRQIKVYGDRTFEDITLTILNDTDFEIRDAYEKWMTLGNSHEPNLGVVNPNDYWADVTITQLSRDGTDLKEYKLVGAMPINVSPIDLDFGAVDTVEEYQVTLAYSYWTNGNDQ